MYMVREIEKDTCLPGVESDLTEITGRFSSDIAGLLSEGNIQNEYDKKNADKVNQLISKYPFLNKYREVLISLDVIQVLGVGKRCIVIDNSREGTVLKLPINEDGYESLKREAHYQNSFLKALKGYYEQFGMYDISEFPISIPVIDFHETTDVDGNGLRYIEMQKVYGHSFFTIELLKKFGNMLQEDESDTYYMTDEQILELFTNKYGLSEENIQSCREHRDRGNFQCLDKDNRSKLRLVCRFLKSKGYRHKDFHNGNLMYDRNTGQMFIIDFGMVQVFRV